MEPSRSYPILLARLKKRFEENPNRKLWLVGIVLCRPQLKIAREEIIPSLSYFNRESGKNIDFFFAGYDVKPVEDSECVPIQTGISSRPDWYFNPDEFDRVVEEIRDKTKKRYRYTGGCDLILVNCLHSETGEAWLDFSDSALAPLEVLRNQGRLPDTSHFFKSIFDYCRASNTGDPAWGLPPLVFAGGERHGFPFPFCCPRLAVDGQHSNFGGHAEESSADPQVGE